MKGVNEYPFEMWYNGMWNDLTFREAEQFILSTRHPQPGTLLAQAEDGAEVVIRDDVRIRLRQRDVDEGERVFITLAGMLALPA